MIKGSNPRKADSEREFGQGIVDLFLGRRSGHLGRYCFSGPRDINDPVRGDEHWTRFIKTSTAYYPYHRVITIIDRAAREICQRAADAEIFVDLGTGSLDSFERKTLPILREGKFKELVLVDGSPSFPAIAADRLQREKLPIRMKSCIIENFFHELPVFSRKAVISLFGITLGNIIVDLPSETPDQVLENTMRHFVSALAKHSGYFIFDYDTNNDAPSIHRAYDHPAYRAMEMTILERVKRDLPTRNFDPHDFEHVTVWYPQWGLCAQELRAKQNVAFQLAGHPIAVPGGRSFRTGNSFKYSDQMVEGVARRAGFEGLHVFSIPDSTMRVAVAAVRREAAMPSKPLALHA